MYLEGFINVLSSFPGSVRKLCAFHNQEIFFLLFPRQGNVDPWPLSCFHLRCFLFLSIVFVCLQLWMSLSRWFWSAHSLMLLIMIMIQPVLSMVLMVISDARSLLDLVRRRWGSLWAGWSGHHTAVDVSWWWSVGWSVF